MGQYADSPWKQYSQRDTQALIEVLSGGAWKALRAPLPSNADAQPHAFLTSVACPGPGFCIAVGSYQTDGKAVALILELSAGTWTALEPALPAGGSGYAALSAVACPAIGACVAAGTYGRSSGDAGFVLEQAGTGWRATVLPGPSGTDLNFQFVACWKTGGCAALGIIVLRHDELYVTQPVIATDSKSGWRKQLLALPGNPDFSTQSLGGLACPGPSTCVGVGNYSYSDRKGGQITKPLLVLDTNGTWATRQAPIPIKGAASQAELNGVTCANASSCTAVGSYSRNAGGYLSSFMVTGAGKTWAAGSVLPPSGSTIRASVIQAVACPTATSCVAAGTYVGGNGNTQPWITVESAGRWAGRLLPFPRSIGAAQDVGLSSVSCPAPGSCVALGTNARRGVLVDVFTGGRWKAKHVLSLPANAAWSPGSGYGPQWMGDVPAVTATDVQCVRMRSCSGLATYSGADGNPHLAVITAFNGKWSLKEAPVAKGTARQWYAESDRISCWLSGCLVVGYYTDGQGGTRTLMLTESGGRWSASNAPLPANADKGSPPMPISGSTALSGVSCQSNGFCAAVGSYLRKSGDYAPLMVTGTAGHWKATEGPLPPDAATMANWGYSEVQLDDVSCVRKACTAIGSYLSRGGGTRALILARTGKKWVATGILEGKPEDSFADLSSVSCSTTRSCVVVGEPWADGTLILTGAGTSWKRSSLPHIPGTGTQVQAILNHVQCTSTGSCLAIGEYFDKLGDSEGVLAQRTALGAWKPVRAQIPRGAEPRDGTQWVWLQSESCPSGAACVAVGSYQDATGVMQGLVERQR